jgi:hypothetical protein
MSVSFRHAFAQGPVLAALGRAAISSLHGDRATMKTEVPGPWIHAELPPRSEDLLRDYIRHVGGDPAWYRGRVPAHLFPQWGFPLAARALAGLSYPLARTMNAGCRIESHAPLPSGEPLLVRARIESIDDDGRRAIITQRVVTGTRASPDAVVADLRAFVPLAKKGDGGASPAKPRPTVPQGVHELAFGRIRSDAGLDFAKLTGDFNPIHWVPAYARASGFRACILHGFSTLARAIEALNRARFAGDVSRLTLVDARFSRPLVLPAQVGVYVDGGDGLWVGDAPGGGAYLQGRYETEAGR